MFLNYRLPNKHLDDLPLLHSKSTFALYLPLICLSKLNLLQQIECETSSFDIRFVDYISIVGTCA